MISIVGGSDKFIQWSLDAWVDVTDCTYGVPESVCFSRTPHNVPFIVSVERTEDNKFIAQVPNFLLQTAVPITVQVYYWDSDASHVVKVTNVFEVVSAPKPNNYVYTEAPSLNYDVLCKHITELLADYTTSSNLDMDLGNGGALEGFIFLMSSSIASSSGKYYTNTMYIPENINVEFVTATYVNGSVNVTVPDLTMQRAHCSLQFYTNDATLAGKALTVSLKLKFK